MKKIFSLLVKSNIAKNFLSLSAAEIFARIISLITFAYLARVLTPNGFGVIGFAAAFVSYFVLIVNFGLDDYGAREIAKNEESSSRYVNAIVSFKLITVIPLFILLTACAFLFASDSTIRIAIILAGINLFSSSISVDWFYQGIQKMGYIAVRQAAASTLNFVLIIIFVSNPSDVLLAVGISSFSFLVNALLLFGVYNKTVNRFRFEKSKQVLKQILIESMPIAVSSFMIAVYYNLDMVMLGYMKGEYEVGIYNAAVKIFLLGNISYILVLKTFYPSLSKIGLSGSGEFKTNYRNYFYSMLSFGIITSLIIFFFAPLIITIIYGSAYSGSVDVLKIFGMNSIVVCINMIFGNPLVAWGRQKSYSIIVGSGAVSNIILNFLLIPTYSYYGASIATLASEMVVFIGLVYLSGKIFSGIKYKMNI